MSLGIYLVFGVLLVPLYLVLAGWLLGRPRDNKTVMIGLLFLLAILLGPVIFSLAPISFRFIIP